MNTDIEKKVFNIESIIKEDISKKLIIILDKCPDKKILLHMALFDVKPEEKDYIDKKIRERLKKDMGIETTSSYNPKTNKLILEYIISKKEFTRKLAKKYL